MLGVCAAEAGGVQEVMGLEAVRKKRGKCMGTDRRM